MNMRLALRYLGERKLRTALTTLAIVLGVTLIFGLNSILPAMQGAFRQNLMATADLTDLTVTSAARGVFGAEAVDTVAATPGVARATGSLIRPLILPSGEALTGKDGRPVNSLILVGLDPFTSRQVRPLRAVAGRLLEAGDATAQVVLIGQTLAESTGLTVGDTLGLPSADGQAQFEVVGIVTRRPTPGAEEIYVPLASAQQLLNLTGLINTVEAMFVTSADIDPATIRQDVLDRLGPGFKMGANEAGTEFEGAMQIGGYAISFFGVAALVMGAFIIFITFRTSVVERRRDIGMLRSLGASRRTILGLLLTESLIQGIVGTALGIVLGYAMGVGLVAAAGQMMENMMGFQLPSPVPTAGAFALAIGLGVGFTVLGSVLPAVSASRLTPLEAMAPPRPEAETRARPRRVVAGVVLGALALAGLLSGNLAFSGLGAILFLVTLLVAGPILVAPVSRVFGGLLRAVFAREGRVAESNLTRQPGRAAVTAAVMMIGLTILVVMGGLATSLTDGMGDFITSSFGAADYLVMPQSLVLGGGNVGAGPGLLESIRQTPGVTAATSLRLATTRGEGLPDFQLVGVDPLLYPVLGGLTFTEGDPDEAYAAIQAGRAIIVNNILAATCGAKAGQDLTVITPNGREVYRVAAVGSDFINFKLATGFISQANLALDFSETSDLLILAARDPEADPAVVATALENIVRSYPAFSFFSTTQWQADMSSMIGSVMYVFYVLMLFLAAPSLIALVNTLGINVIERTREIGVLRAVGATRRQVGRIILAESLLLAAAGTAYGILAGLWLGYVLVGAMETSYFSFLSYFFPYGAILATVAVGLLFGVVGALLPARQAARLDVVKALQYE